jgi:bifunctional non-homologous end joining protein LigD
VEPRKEQRGHRLYLDIMRNAYAQTVVAPYSVRGRPGAHVSAPLHWSEVEDATLNPGQFTMRTIAAELERRSDPWAGMARRRRRLPR